MRSYPGKHRSNPEAQRHLFIELSSLSSGKFRVGCAVSNCPVSGPAEEPGAVECLQGRAIYRDSQPGQHCPTTVKRWSEQAENRAVGCNQYRGDGKSQVISISEDTPSPASIMTPSLPTIGEAIGLGMISDSMPSSMQDMAPSSTSLLEGEDKKSWTEGDRRH